MSLLAQCPTKAALQAVTSKAQADFQERVTDFQHLLQQSLQQRAGIGKHLLRLWLISSASKLEDVDATRVWRRLAHFLPRSADDDEQYKPFCLQLLHLVSQAEPAEIGRLLSKHPRVIRHLFEDDPQHITTWFQCSYVGNLSEFRHGARALAQYSLLHRSEMWDLLVWQDKHPQAPLAVAAKPYCSIKVFKSNTWPLAQQLLSGMQMWDLLVWQGKHPQAPVAVAAKPYYFSELNIKRTVRNLLKHHQQFFASQHMLDTVRSGDIIALDANFFCEELYEVLADEGQDVVDAIKLVLARQPFQQICQRLLHCIGDNDLLEFLSGISGKSYGQRQLERLVAAAAREGAPTAASAARQLEQCLQLMVFGCVSWQKLDTLAAYAAWAFHFQQCFNSLGTMDQDLIQQARMICSPESAPVLWSMLSHGSHERESDIFQQTLLSLLAVRCTLAQHQNGPDQQQIQLLTDAGISATKSTTAQHDILRPPKKRRLHKRKRRKGKRRRTEGMMPMSGESDEDISDSELGIMPAEFNETRRQQHVVWKVTIADQVYREVSEQDLPDLVLQSVLMRWLSHLWKK